MLQSVPVCMFHHVNEHEQDFITVNTDRFQAMMAMLAREGYTTLSSQEFYEYKIGAKKVPQKSVLLTFDDGWLDIFINAYPIMKKYGHKFTVFVVSGWTDQATRFPRKTDPKVFPLHHQAEGYINTPRINEVVCNWNDLEVMLKSGLCSVENHTASHGSDPDVRADIEKGREMIRKKLGISAKQLCWPKGIHNQVSIRIARDLGIDITYLIRRGVNLPRLWTMKIKRFTVDDYSEKKLRENLKIFSRPLYGYLYSRLKPDRNKEKLVRLFRKITCL